MTQDWKGKKVLILGLGQYAKGSGIAAALYFARAKADVVVSDFYYSDAMKKNAARLKRFKNVRCVFNQHPLDEVHSADLVVRHQRIRLSEPEMQEALKLGKPIETAESLFLKLCPCLVVGITGTRGKSTTTTLVYDMLRASKKQVVLGGNILISPLTFLATLKKSQIVVLELSSFQLEGTGASGISPRVACVTNLMRDHLNAYANMDEYAEAKAQIFRHQTVNDTVVLNGDDAFGREWATEAPGTVRIFTAKKRKGSDAWIEGTQLVMSTTAHTKPREQVVVADFDALKVFGTHNHLNMLAAALTAQATGASIPAIRRALAAFRGLKDRQEIIAVKRGVTFINDTTATTPDGTIAALHAIGPRFKKMRLILGGADKELEFEGLAKVLRRWKPEIVVLPGTAHDKLTRALKTAKVSYEDVATLKEAVSRLRARALAGDAVILSPGCASFGLFKNEFDRGQQFRKLVGR
jgi:UDP-N-acetylmuramoylalanine--D-glutamate ligase